MSAPALVPYTQHFDFSIFDAVFVREAFGHMEDGAWATYAGVQWDRWQSDEVFWSERLGAYQGGITPPLATVYDLMLVGATVQHIEPLSLAIVPEMTATSEVLLRLNSGATLAVTAKTHYDGLNPQGDTATGYGVLYSCATGAAISQTSASSFGVVPDGSYVLWSSAGGEWSAVRVRVGAGAWSCAPGVYPGPGCPLYRKTGTELVTIDGNNEATYRAVFDPLARMVSASYILKQDLQIGESLIAAGALLLGGLRATERGPMSALWILHADGTGELLGGNLNYSSGLCECGKTNHYASDIGQNEDGELFLLSECSLFRFEPQRARVIERLALYPESTDGHPGGNCLRFPRGEVDYWTESFGAVGDGTAHYNRLVRRVGGVDAPGPSTLWHGTNCAESYLNRFWAIRSDDSETLYLDWIDNAHWHNFAGISRPLATHFWQRLRAMGTALYLFGYHTQGQTDVPRCAIGDGITLREAAFPYFIRRATTCPKVGRDEAMFVVARSQAQGIGPAKRVVEILPQSAQTVCASWNASAQAFRFTRAAFAAAGGAVDLLPPYLVWEATPGRDAGGVWKPALTASSSWPYLVLNTSLSTLIGYTVGANGLPYSPGSYDTICFEVLSDGSIEIVLPRTTCTNALCVKDRMPDGTKFRVIVRPVSDPASPVTAIQITDTSGLNRLSMEREEWHTLWARTDSTAPLEDLSTYTQPLSYSQLSLLEHEARTRVDVVLLVSPSNQPLHPTELPKVQRRA